MLDNFFNDTFRYINICCTRTFGKKEKKKNTVYSKTARLIMKPYTERIISVEWKLYFLTTRKLHDPLYFTK